MKAVSYTHLTREHRHFPHPGRTPFACPDFLDNLKSFLVYDRLMGAFKDFPLVRAVIDGLVDFIGFYMGLEIHCMPQIMGRSTKVVLSGKSNPLSANDPSSAMGAEVA